MAEKAGVYYAYGRRFKSEAPGSAECHIVIDSDNVMWLDKNWPTEQSIGIPMQEIEDLIAEYKKNFPQRTQCQQPKTSN
jgi:hypothetical protein